jgi:hypothetical protein
MSGAISLAGLDGAGASPRLVMPLSPPWLGSGHRARPRPPGASGGRVRHFPGRRGEAWAGIPVPADGPPSWPASRLSPVTRAVSWPAWPRADGPSPLWAPGVAGSGPSGVSRSGRVPSSHPDTEVSVQNFAPLPGSQSWKGALAPLDDYGGAWAVGPAAHGPGGLGLDRGIIWPWDAWDLVLDLWGRMC